MGHYGPAKNLSDKEFSELLQGVTRLSSTPEMDRVAFLLSYKAGLRVQEIAGLRWTENVLSSSGDFITQVGYEFDKKGNPTEVFYPAIYVSRAIGKYSTDRHIPIHPILKEAFVELKKFGADGYVIKSRYKTSQDLKARTHALKMRIARIYAKLGFVECSSHSGRRTFITNAARKAAIANCSLRDVQILAGHRHINTTQSYIAASPNQYNLVALT